MIPVSISLVIILVIFLRSSLWFTSETSLACTMHKFIFTNGLDQVWYDVTYWSNVKKQTCAWRKTNLLVHIRQSIFLVPKEDFYLVIKSLSELGPACSPGLGQTSRLKEHLTEVLTDHLPTRSLCRQRELNQTCVGY